MGLSRLESRRDLILASFGETKNEDQELFDDCRVNPRRADERGGGAMRTAERRQVACGGLSR